MRLSLFLLGVLMVAAAAHAQEDTELDAEEVFEDTSFQEQAPEMTPEEAAQRRAIEHVFMSIEPECQQQLEALMKQPDAGHELSPECMEQVQKASAEVQPPSGEAPQKAKEPLPTEWYRHPGFAIFLFLIALVGSVVAYLNYYNTNIKPNLKKLNPKREARKEKKPKRM